MLSVTITTTPETKTMLSRLPTDWYNALYKGIKESTKKIENYIKESFGSVGKPKIRTGKLKASIIGEVEKSGNTFIGLLSSNLDYAAVQEFGATIKSLKSQYLTFQINGQWVKVREVIIPARPYLLPGVEDNIDDIGITITTIISQELE
jgi:phage gpG-like protein